MDDNAVFSWVALQAQFSCCQPLLFLWCTAAFKRKHVAWQLIVKITCGDIWMAYRRLQPRKKKWSWRKTSKIWKGGTAACLPTFVAEKQALAEICACIAISVCHIANCFGWRQYVLRNLPVGFPVRPIIGPEKCFCRCRLHIASPGVHQDPRNVFKPFKGYNDRGRQVRAGEDSRL